MRLRLYQKLQSCCIGSACIVLGTLIGSHFARTPAVVHQAAHQSEDAEEALAYVIPEVDLQGTPFNEAVERVRKLSPVPIVVHWEKLAYVSLDPKSPVTFRARNVTLGRVLSELVSAIQTPQAHAAYAPAGNVVLISTAYDAELRGAVVRSYEVRDLLRPPADPWETRDLSYPFTEVSNVQSLPPKIPAPRPDDLVQLIQESVASDSWRETGGQVGSIQFFAGRLIVTQTWENHRQVAQLLANLREPAPLPAPPPPTPDLEIWNNTLKKYVSTDPSAGEAALRRRIPEVRFDRVPLKRAIATLADLAQANLVVDWPAIEPAGMLYTTPVSLRLHDVTFAEALRALLVASGSGHLDFRINGGCVILGLPTGGDGFEFATRVYDMREWLAELMGAPPTPAPKTPSDLSNWAALRDAHVDQLIEVIVDTIAPDSWRDTGGTIGSIKELNGRLIVTQTWENQERVADLLAAIRTDPSRLQAPPATAPGVPATLPATQP